MSGATRLVDDVTDTARWVAYYRALESERPGALFRDPFARRLAGERGRAIAEALPKNQLDWAIAVRTRVYDELILDVVDRGEVSAVVNLAAGMDARPYRLRLPSSLRWIEADSASLLRAKEQALRGEEPRCRVERTPLDVADQGARRAFLQSIERDHASVLVVTEGLLAYLDEVTVASLAGDLHACAPVRWWALEAASPAVIARARRAWGAPLKRARAEMKFAPASGLGFFEAHGWTARDARSVTLEAQRLGREMRFAALARAVTCLTARGRERWRTMVMYAMMERRG
jgi:methyltransferase (TIGR00027 family)